MEYGNALGVPNLGGDVFFDPTFDDNCLVNVVAVGVCPESRIIRSRVPEAAREVPHVLILVGKPTDMTGFGGASFASAALDADRAHEQKGAVQVHDPFLKRVLFEATEAVFAFCEARGIAIGFKDLGAGGLACAAVELAAAQGMGMEVDLSLVPVDSPDHKPEVIACAETQERFAIVVPAEIAPEILAIYNEEFELPALYPGARAAVIGKVVAEDRFVLKHKRARVGDLAATVVTAGIRHERPAAPLAAPPGAQPEPPCADAGATLQALLARPNLCSREHIYRGYDTDVRGRAVVRPGEADAGVIAPVPGAPLGLAFAVDGTPAYGLVDPYLAAVHATLEAMRNVACVGAEPIALTDCLNYGSPEDPQVMAAFTAGVEGIAAAARGIGRRHEASEPVPVVSGNVSFYNHSAAGKAIAPSPIVACAGRLEDYSRVVTMRMKGEGSRILLIGERRPELGGSEFLRYIADGNGGNLGGPLPAVDLARERTQLYAVLDLIDRGWIRAAHDIAAGGLAIAVAEMLLGVAARPRIGVALELDALAPELGCGVAPLRRGAGLSPRGGAGRSRAGARAPRRVRGHGLRSRDDDREAASRDRARRSCARRYRSRNARHRAPRRARRAHGLGGEMDARDMDPKDRFRIAVLQLPGVNCEHETARAVRAAGLSAEVVRWTRRDLDDFHGFVLPGGFSFQDRVRAGAIAAREPALAAVVRAAHDGRPVLGICNGAQVLIEAGLVPDLDGEGRIEMGLAPNAMPARQGYYCTWVYTVPTVRGRESAFGLAFADGEVMPAVAAHGEGRFVTRDPAIEAAVRSEEVVGFRYVAADGSAARGFPANPNGSLADAAGIMNMAGNVLAFMPHPERAAWLYQVGWEVEGPWGERHRAAHGDHAGLAGPGPGLRMFTSMRLYLERRARGGDGEVAAAAAREAGR